MRNLYNNIIVDSGGEEKYDYEVLKEFIRNKDKKHFVSFENVFSPISEKIVIMYRTLTSSERRVINRDEYEARLLSKQREDKLNQIL